MKKRAKRAAALIMMAWMGAACGGEEPDISLPSQAQDGEALGVLASWQAQEVGDVLVARAPTPTAFSTQDVLRVTAEIASEGEVIREVISDHVAVDLEQGILSVRLSPERTRGLAYTIERLGDDGSTYAALATLEPSMHTKGFSLPLPIFPRPIPELPRPSAPAISIRATTPARNATIPRYRVNKLDHRIDVTFAGPLDCSRLATKAMSDASQSVDNAFNVTTRRTGLDTWANQVMYMNSEAPSEYDAAGRADPLYRGRLECRGQTLSFFMPGPLHGASDVFVNVVAYDTSGRRLREQLRLTAEDPILEITARSFYNHIDTYCDGVLSNRNGWRRCDLYLFAAHAVDTGSGPTFDFENQGKKFPTHGVWEDSRRDVTYDLTGEENVVFKGLPEMGVYLDFIAMDQDAYEATARNVRIMGAVGDVISSAWGYPAAGAAGDRMHGRIADALLADEDDLLGNALVYLSREDGFWGLNDRYRAVYRGAPVAELDVKGSARVEYFIDESPRSWLNPHELY